MSRRLSGATQTQHSSSCVHLIVSLALSFAAAILVVFCFAALGSADMLADMIVRCAAGFFAYHLWMLLTR